MIPEVLIDTVGWNGSILEGGFDSGTRHHRRRELDVMTGDLRSMTDHFELPCGIRVSVQRGAATARFEGSVAKVDQQHNICGVPWRVALNVMRKAETEAKGFVTLRGDIMHRRLHRLDVVRDFHAPNMARLIHGLGNDPSFLRTGSDRYKTPRGPSAGGLVRGPEVARSKLYDKATEARRQIKRLPEDMQSEALRLAAHRLRYELQMRGKHLRALGICEVADCDISIVSAEAQRQFGLVAFGNRVASKDGLLDLVLALDKGSDIKVKIYGWLCAGQRASEFGLSPHTVDVYRQIIRENGLVLDPSHAPGTIRLDYGLGCEVVT